LRFLYKIFTEGAYAPYAPCMGTPLSAPTAAQLVAVAGARL